MIISSSGLGYPWSSLKLFKTHNTMAKVISPDEETIGCVGVGWMCVCVGVCGGVCGCVGV